MKRDANSTQESGDARRPPGSAKAAASGPSPESSATGAVVSGSLDLIGRFCEALAAEDVSYCHWKSTTTLDRAALGEGDLDLLVDRRRSQRFLEILRRLGFKEARGAREIPGVFHAFGLDAPSGKLVHVHAHYALVLGDDMTKNYRLPIESAYLGSARQGAVFRVPAPEYELAVLVIRLVLKHAPWDAIVIGRGPLSAAERDELEDLTRRVPTPLVHDCVRTHLPFVGESLWEDCRRALEPGAALWSRVRVARRLEASLASQGRRARAVDTWLKLSRRGSGFLARRLALRGRPRLRLDCGGALIAIVGSDGAGKSTAAAALHAWLARDLETVRLQLGNPSRSRVRGVEASPQGRMGVRPVARLAWKVMQARDRYREYVRAQRLASGGALVICDRFPIPGIRPKDGAVATRLLDEPGRGPLVRYLARLERSYHHRIRYPDILIVLRVDPDIAVERRHDEENPDFVRRQAEEIWRLDLRDTPASVLDAGRPRDEVLAEIKRSVWSSL